MATRFSIIILALISLAGLLAGCTYERNGPIRFHYLDFKLSPPKGNLVTVCHAYGCSMQTKVRFGPAQIEKIKRVMKKIPRKDTPYEERRAVAYAVSWMERYVGKITGTSGDRAGMEFDGSGDPTQQDCVDEATNTTSYLLVLQHNKLLKHHTVGTPFSKGNILMGVKYWPHWTAVLKENETNVKYAVDSWIYANGENPAVVKATDWYLKDLDRLPKSTN